MRLPTVVALALAAALPAHAAPIVHDSAAEFVTYTDGTRIRSTLNTPSLRGTQGQQRDGSNVPNDRSDIDDLFPGTTRFYSLGIGVGADPRVTVPTAATPGTLILTINPNDRRRIISGGLTEITFTGGDRHAEAAWVFLGTEARPFATLAGLFWNEDADRGVAGAWSAGPFATLSATNQAGGDGGVFSLAVIGGDFTTLSFLDTSLTDLTLPGLDRNLSTFTTTRDGFDIDNLSITSDTVPAPAAFVLFGLGVGGLGLLRRR